MTRSPTNPRGRVERLGTVSMSGDPSDSQGRIAAVLVSTTALRCVARKPASLAPELRRLRSRLDKRPPRRSSQRVRLPEKRVRVGVTQRG